MQVSQTVKRNIYVTIILPAVAPPQRVGFRREHAA
jgi:hypothetical protein